MYRLTQIVMRKGLFQGLVAVFVLGALALLPPQVSAQEDPCKSTGMFVNNSTDLDIWYKLNEGACHGWVHDSIRLNIKPGDRLNLYRDLTCQTPYCPETLTYQRFTARDANRDCTVLVMPDCDVGDLR